MAAGCPPGPLHRCAGQALSCTSSAHDLQSSQAPSSSSVMFSYPLFSHLIVIAMQEHKESKKAWEGYTNSRFVLKDPSMIHLAQGSQC